jgi:hypothetical protein
MVNPNDHFSGGRVARHICIYSVSGFAFRVFGVFCGFALGGSDGGNPLTLLAPRHSLGGRSYDSRQPK